jgi:transcriptional regulator with XRE-family HTH domain
MADDLIEARLEELSDRIRRWREEAGLTLVELGEKSGVAPSTIQKIESRQMTPSIAVLLKIAFGLGIEAGDLIAPSDPAKLNIVVQKAGQHASIKASSKLRFEHLSAEILGCELECWRVIIAPGHQTSLPQPQMLGEQIIVCERGRVELVLDLQAYELSSGDTLHCRSKLMYGLSNRGRGEAAYLISGRFPHSLRAELGST